MVQEHEYALLGGVNRSKVGRIIGLLAASASAGIVFLLLAAVDVAQRLGIPANLPPAVFSLMGAGAVFTALYWVFNRYLWRWPWVSSLMKVPDLSGKWHCDGRTIQSDGKPGYVWDGTATIIQSWDKLRICLKTKHSGSNSISAALLCDSAEGYRLLYNYRNDPRIEETELKSHLGFAELVFDKTLKSAEGEYFNGHGRYTFGTMKLTRL